MLDETEDVSFHVEKVDMNFRTSQQRKQEIQIIKPIPQQI